MKSWLRAPFSILALVAMLATLVPETVWACPVTGRIDSARRVCAMLESAPSAAQSEMPCAQMGGQCCKPVSAPTPQNDDSQRALLGTATPQVSFFLALARPVFDAGPYVAPRVETGEAPAVRWFLARFSNSPPSFWTQHRPVSLAGRAPPVL